MFTDRRTLNEFISGVMAYRDNEI